MVAQREQPLARARRQRARARGVETQLPRARDLVDVLAARALRANRRELELGSRNRHAAADAQPLPAGHAQFAGSMRKIAPASSSVSTYKSPSGPCRTSR